MIRHQAGEFAGFFVAPRGFMTASIDAANDSNPATIPL